MTVRAMKAGAVEFLTKPIREQDLLDAVRTALDRDFARRQQSLKYLRRWQTPVVYFISTRMP
jgi:FixJ family two-component response regulator